MGDGREASRPVAGRVSLDATLPRAAYVEPASFELERERILFREWFCVGRGEEIPGPGDYLVVEVAGESIVLVRDADGEVRGHYNVCRHRGCQVAPDGPSRPGAPSPTDVSASVAARLAGPPWGPTGTFEGGRIRCPYHSWTYRLDGTVRTAPFLSDRADFDRSAFSLHPVGVAAWGGFVFVNLTPDVPAPDGGSAAGDEPPAGIHRAPDGNPVAGAEQGRGAADADPRSVAADAGPGRGAPLDGPPPAGPLRAAPLGHQLGPIPGRLARYPLADLRIARRIVYDVAANWKVILENYNECYHCATVHPELCALVPAFRRNGGAGLDWEAGIPHRDGAWTFTLSGTTTRTPFAGLSEAERTRHFGELAYPNLMLSLAADHVAAFTLWPRAADRTAIVFDVLVDPLEMAKPDYDPMDAVAFWDLVNGQDWRICEATQRGMSSRVFRHGHYAPMEDLAADMRRYIGEKLGRAALGPAAASLDTPNPPAGPPPADESM